VLTAAVLIGSRTLPAIMGRERTFLPARLVTERLCIRPLEETDVDALFVLKSDPLVTRCYGQEPHSHIERTRAWVLRNLEDQRRGEVLYWALELLDGGEAIGACCLWNFNDARTCAEIGYELRPELWRKGIMTEALSAILDRAFGDLGLHRIEANPLATNLASIGTLLKLGFRREGVLRQRQLLEGRFVDQWYLGLLEDERPGLRSA
jgi:ribosomal-protein-alanine N-acetyltransferase